MSSHLDVSFFSVTSTTVLPGNNSNDISNGITTTSRPYTRSQAARSSPGHGISVPQLRSSAPLPRKRGRKSEFTIFVDPVTESNSSEPESKRPRTNSRLPLAARSSSANSSPAPSPRSPDTPFARRTIDPWWEDSENYDPRPFITPRPTPVRRSSNYSPLLDSPSPSTSRATRLRGVKRSSPLPTPRSMTLYHALGLENWRASTEEVRLAWRKVALENHPDKVAEKNKEAATMKMQQLNAARDMLSDRKRRRRYHVDGKLPWVA